MTYLPHKIAYIFCESVVHSNLCRRSQSEMVFTRKNAVVKNFALARSIIVLIVA